MTMVLPRKVCPNIFTVWRKDKVGCERVLLAGDSFVSARLATSSTLLPQRIDAQVLTTAVVPSYSSNSCLLLAQSRNLWS
jgi:hypothetical protein